MKEVANIEEAIPVTEQTGNKGRWAKGTSGNPAGRPRGSRNRVSLLMEALLEEDAADLTRKLIELAKSGNLAALRLCVDRMLPRRRDRSVQLELPATDTAQGISAAAGTIFTAIGNGEITPNEGDQLTRILEVKLKIVEAADRERTAAQFDPFSKLG